MGAKRVPNERRQLGLLIDIHVHTKAHSPCSQLDPGRLVRQAVKAGLDGLVITEHHYQWQRDDLDELARQADEARFLLLAGFEYASGQGDVLLYGLEANCAREWSPGVQPGEIVRRAHDLGGVCVAAHPTRAGLGFDDSILTIPFDAIEVRSVNMKEHEQRLAIQLAADTGLRAAAGSDAHQLYDVGRYATEFDDPIQSNADLLEALGSGRFRPAPRTMAQAGIA